MTYEVVVPLAALTFAIGGGLILRYNVRRFEARVNARSRCHPVE